MLSRNTLSFGISVFKSVKSLKHGSNTLLQLCRNGSSYLLEENFKSKLEKLPAECADNILQYEDLEKKNDEAFSVASYEQTSLRNFFTTERFDDRTSPKITFQGYKYIKELLKDAVDLETKKITKKLPRDIQVSLFKLLSAAKDYQDREAFVKDGHLERWWIVYNRCLQWADPVTLEPMYSSEKISRTINSFVQLNIQMKDEISKTVFVDRVRTMIEALYERKTILTSRSLSMLLCNTRHAINDDLFGGADSNLSDIEQMQHAPAWLKDRLNQFMLRFYKHVPGIERLDSNSDHSSRYGYETKDNTLIALYYAASLGVRTPTDKRVLQLLANIFYDVLLSDDPYQTSDKPLIQQVRFSKALYVCEAWDFDICALCTRPGVATNRRDSWHKLYTTIGELLHKRPARLGSEKESFVQMALLLNSLIVASKYGLEDLFVAELFHYWKLFYANLSSLTGLRRKRLANAVKAGRFGHKANKYSDMGILIHLFEIIS